MQEKKKTDVIKNKNNSTRPKDTRKDEIVSFALKVFCEKGYDNTKIDDIANRAGISHGLLYHYFKNKHEIFEAVIHSKKISLMTDLFAQVENEKSCANKLRIIINCIYTQLKEDENFPYYFYMFVRQSFIHRDSDLKDLIKDDSHHPVLLLENIFLEGQKNGEFSDKYTPKECTEVFASIIQGATLGYVIAPKDLRKNMSLPKTDFIIDIYKKGEQND